MHSRLNSATLCVPGARYCASAAKIASDFGPGTRIWRTVVTAVPPPLFPLIDHRRNRRLPAPLPPWTVRNSASPLFYLYLYVWDGERHSPRPTTPTPAPPLSL